jgi:DNA modification methylase
MIHHGDLFDVLPTLADASIDACVTDPPYGIGFMGREWDTFKPSAMKDTDRFHQVDRSRVNHPNPNLRNRTRSPALSPSQIDYDYSTAGLRAFKAWTEQWAREVFRVLKPGAYLVVCGAPRSYHRMACGLEDAGFVIRDKFSWLFGSGFPKNYNLGDGKGTALKPAHEPIALAWKPFKGSIKACHEVHGTAALNIDACRIEANGRPLLVGDYKATADNVYEGRQDGSLMGGSRAAGDTDLGRWPANVLLDEYAAEALDEMTGNLVSGGTPAFRSPDQEHRNALGGFKGNPVVEDRRPADIGGASRFYYVAKPSREERDYGCEGLTARQRDESRKDGNPGGDNPRNRGLQPRGNFHPTVKPVALMRWLVRLVTPIDGVVLDPFTGSGTTGMACRYEHRRFIGIEREADYVAIAERRIAAIAPLFAGEASE